jgi:hypothetical protein
MKSVGMVSSDVTDPSGLTPPDGIVGLADAVWIGTRMANLAYDYCVDYNQDGRVSVADAFTVARPIRVISTCACSPVVSPACRTCIP